MLFVLDALKEHALDESEAAGQNHAHGARYRDLPAERMISIELGGTLVAYMAVKYLRRR
jgi:hypothetical protein